ncbi:MAG: choice-of-anchor B family protein [Ignavibacteria bacterium]
MKNLFLILSLLLILSNNAFSQLPNQGTYLLKNLDIAGRYYSACWGYTATNGREYAILGYSGGTAFIDITDSANIREVDVISGISSSWREMKVYDHYAYIVSEAFNSRLQIVDLQYLPDSVSLVKVWSYPGWSNTHSISQSGPYLYLNGGNATANGGITILDITDPVNPVKKGQWTTQYVHDCRVLDDTIYAANINVGRITVINATNKNSLQQIATWNNLPNPDPHNCAITKDRNYILVTDENNAPGKLKIWNIQDLTNITFVTSWQPTGITTTIVHNVEIYGDYAIIAHYTSGIRIVNISNPASPMEAGWYDTRPLDNSNDYEGCWGVFKFPSGKIIGSDIDNGLFVIKTTFPLTDINNTTEIPDSYSLNQNYPNPYNPTTNIKFSLKDNSNVSLKIFDIQGKEVAEILNDRRDGGNYEVEFNADNFNLSSGTYFYTLNVESGKQSFAETKKMILIK